MSVVALSSPFTPMAPYLNGAPMAPYLSGLGQAGCPVDLSDAALAAAGFKPSGAAKGFNASYSNYRNYVQTLATYPDTELAARQAKWLDPSTWQYLALKLAVAMRACSARAAGGGGTAPGGAAPGIFANKGLWIGLGALVVAAGAFFLTRRRK